MKTKIMVFMAAALFVALMVSPVNSATKVTEPSKHELTITITYNSVTLQQAADIERRMKEQNQGACGVKLKLKPVENQSYIVFDNDSSSFFAPATKILTPNSLKGESK